MTNDPTEARRRELSHLLQALSDHPIGPEDPRYFPFHEAPGHPRGADPVARLRSPITLTPDRGTCQIFSGFRGTGKSSELRRLRAELASGGRLAHHLGCAALPAAHELGREDAL